MEQKSKIPESKPEITGKAKRLLNLRPPFKKGDKTLNPKGHPKGQKNFKTLFREALINLGKLNGKTPNELELELVQSGFLNARKGNYSFYKDILDRLHGQAKQGVDVTSDGEKIQSIIYLPSKK